MKTDKAAYEKSQKQRTDSILKEMKKDFVFKTDSFTQGMPINVIPKYVIQNNPSDYVFAYFSIAGNNASNLHLIIMSSYENSIDGCSMMNFNVDGKVCQLILQNDMTTKTNRGYKYNLYSAYGVELLDSLSLSTKEVKMRMTDLEVYKDRKLSKREIHDLYLAYKYFNELNGKLEDIKD